MPHRKSDVVHALPTTLSPPASVCLGALTQQILASARWRGSDEFPASQIWADDVERVLAFLKVEGRLEAFLDMLRSVQAPQHRDAYLAEARAAFHLARSGFRIIQWKPSGEGATKGEVLVSFPGSPDIFVEVKHPGWRAEHRPRRTSDLTRLSPALRQRCFERMKQDKYIDGDGGSVAPHVAAMDVVRRNVLPKLTNLRPNLAIVVDDLLVTPVGLPGLAHLVEREFASPDHDPDDPKDVLTYERLGGVLFLHPTAENSETIYYRADFVQNPGALQSCALPHSVARVFSDMREKTRSLIAQKYAGRPSILDILSRKGLLYPHLVFEVFGETGLLLQRGPSAAVRLEGFALDSFAERHWPVAGRPFHSRTGTWLCDLSAPVDVSGVDRRTFYLQFSQIQSDPRWVGPTLRTLELRTSLISFTQDTSYSPWLLLVVDGFLDTEEIDRSQEVYEVERAPAQAPSAPRQLWL